MKIIILNNSRKKRFIKTQRVINSLLPSISNRLNIGNLPRRTIIQLIKDLKKYSGRGINIKIFIENVSGYHKFEIVQIGKEDFKLQVFNINSKFNEVI